jgi:hypothetical protein
MVKRGVSVPPQKKQIPPEEEAFCELGRFCLLRARGAALFQAAKRRQ